jgi:hypothetical protein
MEIREELPPVDEKKDKKQQHQPSQQRTPASNQLPESVLRARQLMKEADEKINQKKKAQEDADNKALFDLLRELEEEEEEEDQSQVTHPVPKTVVNKPTGDVEEADEDELDSEQEFSDDDDDDRYDTEISENMFDRFGDDEQYPLDGVVDQEDFTYYEEEDEDRSTPKVITKKKTPIIEEATVNESPLIRESVASTVKETPIASVKEENSTSTVNEKAAASVVKEAPIAATPSENSPKKKFSKFKLLRQEQKERPNAKPLPQNTIQQPITPVEEDKEAIPITTDTDEHQLHDAKPARNQAVPQVATKPKKMSRFKLQRAQSKEATAETSTEPNFPTEEAPLVAERIKPKRSVTWDTNTDVRDHDKAAAPSDIASTVSYSQPMKTTPTSSDTKIRTPADIFRQIRPAEDDYPSLDNDTENDQKVDLNELIKVARNSQESLYCPADGSKALIPIVKSTDKEEGMIIAPKSKLDNKIMKGAVMERDVVPVDLEEVEEDMDLREVMANYQKKRQEMLAVSGGFSFPTKPEFEVFDEELPLPRKKQEEEEEEEEEEVKPKKLSRFKAARLGMRMDNEQDY